MIQTRQPHPDPEQLRAFALGQLSPSEQGEVERHVAACRECCERLAGVPDDTFLGRLRHAPSPNTVSPEQAAIDSKLELPLPLIDHPRYRVLRVLGAGGMGVVYHAVHRLMEREVALKVIHPGLMTHPVALQRFRQELLMAAKLNHPNIVAALDAEQVGEVHFLAMEYVEGISLDRLVASQGRLSIARASHIIRQAALGLQHAHEQGMVHRDIKPHNLMVTRKGLLKVLDFGLARVAQEARSKDRRQLTMVGTVLGTPDYIAPEQVTDSRGVDIRADIYSLGCTLYFLLAGHPPFPNGDGLQKALSHVDSVPQPLRNIRTDLPPELAAIIERMMEKLPERRHETPAEVAQALAPFARSGSSQSNRVQPPEVREEIPPESPTRRMGKVESSPPREARVETLPEVEPSPRRMPRRKGRSPRRSGRGWLIGGGIALGAVAVVGLLTLLLLWGMTSKPRALVVMPHQNFWWPDYEPVERVLREGGVEVVIASSIEGTAMPHPDARFLVKAVPVNLTLAAAKGTDYDAIIFIGGKGSIEYVNDRTQQAEARRVMDETLSKGGLVTGVCRGTAVLRASGILNGKRGTGFPWQDDDIHSGGVMHVSQSVVEDGNLITGQSDKVAQQFAERVLLRLREKRR